MSSRHLTFILILMLIRMGAVSCMEKLPDECKVSVPADETRVNAYRPNVLLNGAAEYGHLEQAKHALERGACITVRDCSGCQPIHNASKNGHLPIVKWLIAQGADVNATTPDGWQPIHFAALGGWLDIVELLVANGACVNARSKIGIEPIHAACSQPHVVKWLQARGASINARNDNGYEPIHGAARIGWLEDFKALVACGANIHARTSIGLSPLHFAAQEGHLSLLKWLIKNGATVDPCVSGLSTPLDYAAQKGHLPVIKQLVAYGADSNASNEDSVDSAILAGRLRICEWLIEHGVAFDHDFLFYHDLEYALEKRPLIHELLKSHDLEFKDYLSRGFYPEQWDRAFLLTIALKQQELFNFMVENNFYSPAISFLKVALEIAASVNNVTAFEPLYTKLISFSEQSDQSVDADNIGCVLENALFWGVLRGHKEIVSFIFASQFMPLLSLKKALQAAALANRIDIFKDLYQVALNRVLDVQELLNKNVTLEESLLAQEKFKAMLENALTWAAMRKNEAVVSFILEQAFSYGYAADLSVSRAGQVVTNLLKNQEILSVDEKAVFLRIQEMLVTAARLQESASISVESSTSEHSSDRLFRLVPRLAPELVALILRYALLPRHSHKS